ncbi:hypothetical protein PS1_047665 [Malus domestica]
MHSRSRRTQLKTSPSTTAQFCHFWRGPGIPHRAGYDHSGDQSRPIPRFDRRHHRWRYPPTFSDRSMLAGFDGGDKWVASAPNGWLPRRLLVTSTWPPSPAMAPSSLKKNNSTSAASNNNNVSRSKSKPKSKSNSSEFKKSGSKREPQNQNHRPGDVSEDRNVVGGRESKKSRKEKEGSYHSHNSHNGRKGSAFSFRLGFSSRSSLKAEQVFAGWPS